MIMVTLSVKFWFVAGVKSDSAKHVAEDSWFCLHNHVEDQILSCDMC